MGQPSPRAQQQVLGLVTVSFGPCHHLIAFDFSVNFLDLGNARYKQGYIVDIVYLAEALAPCIIILHRTVFAISQRMKGSNARIYSIGKSRQTFLLLTPF